MDITREKLIEMWGLMGRLAGEKTSVKFHYLLVKNKRLIQSEIESIQEAQEPEKEYMEYEKKRMSLCEVMCEKDDAGKPKVKNQNFIIPEETKEDFDKKMEEMKEEYAEPIEKMDKKRKEFAELLAEEVKIDFVSIPLSVMPESILGGDVDLLFDLINEDG